jgi:hypothetical protein
MTRKSSHSDSLHAAAARGVEAIDALVTERDDLRVGNDRMSSDIALMREKIGQLTSRLSTATAERDHYMRHTVELVARLNNIQTLIVSCIEEAGHAAYKPSLAPPMQVESNIPAEDLAQLEGLISRLPQNGGATN